MVELEYSYIEEFRHFRKNYGESINILLDLLAGSIAGIAITVLGHPFDTLKVRMQSLESKQSMLRLMKATYKNESFFGFYKGLGFPLSTVPIVNAVVFATNEKTKRVFHLHNEEDMSLAEGMFCGGVAGFVNCIVVTPVELVKCRLQVQTEACIKNSYYTGIIDCLVKTWKTEGVRGLYKGNFASIVREIPAYAGWISLIIGQFGGYLFGKTAISKIRNKKMNELSMPEMMLAGSVGGYFCWQFSYPQDVVKTILQTDRTNKYKPVKYLYDGGFFNCTKDIWRQYGLMGFWRGYLPCTIRGLYANAFLFGAYEQAKYMLEGFKLVQQDKEHLDVIEE